MTNLNTSVEGVTDSDCKDALAALLTLAEG
jgi:hypothetical protein